MADRRDSERWRRVEELYHRAIARPADERPALLADACGEDVELRRDVETLIAVTEEAEPFLESPAHDSLVGCDVGPYHVAALLGAGGMGEVYRATDRRLGRDVALKVLHHAFDADPDRLRRFEQEARATAALNHPNIVAVFDVGRHEGLPYFISELLEGETLRARLDRGRLPVREAIDYAIQIATALAAAHDKGIVHRDVKPANIFITADGRAKVLDFGVAKLLDAGSPPEKAGATGTVVGTIGYMAPEQVQGAAVDARSDIFSFGTVLHEMLTGRRPLDEGTVTPTRSVVDDRELPKVVDDDTAVFGRALETARRCLNQNPGARFQSCRDVALALSGALAGSDTGAGSPRRWNRRRTATLVILALAAIIPVWVAVQRAAAPAQIRSVAVLPLENLSRTPDEELFADSMTSALITNLAKVRALRVVSRTSAMRFKHTHKTLEQIGRELNVDAVVLGSVERAGNRVRISAQLIRAATDEHLWADSYDRDLQDVLMLQDEVARSIADKVRVTLTPEERAGLAAARVVDPAAYELYLKGRAAWNERTEGSIQRAITYFTQAIERDGNYAAPYSGLADCYLSLGFSFDVGSVPPREAIPKAKAAALKALALDESLAEAHNSLAYAKLYYDWDWPGAEAEFKRALALNPGSPEAHHWYSHLLVSSRRLDESLAESQKALALDQLNPVMSLHLGWNYFFMRQNDKAVAQLTRTIDLDPNYGLAYWYRGLAYEQQGKFAEALAEMRRGAALLTGNMVVSADIGHVHAAAGHLDEANRVIDELARESKQRYVSPFAIALIHLGRGDTDRAFEWLEKAYQERSDLLIYLTVDPRLDPIRNDPRLKDLVARIGIP